MCAMESLKGKLLISSPALFDPNFRRTIVLIAHHDEDGAMGLVLNRPAELPVDVAAPQLVSLVDGGASVHVGGPVSPESLMVLAEFDDPADSASPVVEEAEPEDAFADDPDTLWRDVLRRKGGAFALLATMPPDPALN